MYLKAELEYSWLKPFNVAGAVPGDERLLQATRELVKGTT